MDTNNTVNGFQMENADKIERVIHGTMGRGGVLEGGLGDGVAEKDPELVLAHYDKLAGYITKDGVKIKTGSFWDFKGRKPRAKPEVMYVFRIGGEKIEVDDPKNLASAISTVEKTLVEKEARIKEKKSKSKLK